MQRLWLGLWAALGVAACAGDGTSEEAPVCSGLAAKQPFYLVESPTGTQIHLDAALGKDRVWLAYNMVDGGGADFGVYLSAISCAGEPLGPPVRVNTTEGRNNVDPIVRVSAEALFVVWSADNKGASASNLDIVYRTFDHDGSPRMASDRDLVTRHEGQEVAGNHWLPNAVLVDDSTLAIAGVRGLPDVPSFQSFVQRVDIDGEPVGEALSPKVESDHSHGFPDIGKDGAGRLYAAWERSKAPAYETTLLAQSRVDDAFALLDAEPQNLLGGAQQAERPRYGRRRQIADPLLLTFRDPADDQVVLMDAEQPGATPVRAGSAGQIHQLPAASSHGGRGLLAWHQVVKGLVNKTVVRSFSYDGGSFELGAEQALAEESLPYGPAVLHVADDIYFVGWTTTESDDRRAKGQLVALP